MGAVGQESGTGFITVFFDTLGIGSFATTTTIFRTWHLVPDELIPGTLNVGHALSGVLGAFIFIGLVPVASETLVAMIVAAGLGAWLGSGLVARLPRYRIRLGMGTALLVAATVMLLTQLRWLPGGGEALGLQGWRWMVAVVGNFVLGSLMTLGIGLYAPCMIMVSLLGMAPLAAFPIMMGSCAFLHAHQLGLASCAKVATTSPPRSAYPRGHTRAPDRGVSRQVPAAHCGPLGRPLRGVLYGMALLRAGRREAKALRLGTIVPAEAPV